MKIAEEYLPQISSSNTIMGELVSTMDVHYTTVSNWIKENKENGPLTTLSALIIIGNALRLPYISLVTNNKAA